VTPLVEAKPNPAEMCRPPLHDSVFDAVGELLADDAWGDVTMAEVAARAGVSRQTLYNAFGNREELASAYLLREAERFVAAIEDAVRSNADEPRAALRAAVILFLSLVSTHPIVRAVSSGGDGDELVPLATTRGGALVAEMTRRLAELLRSSWPGLDPGDTRLLSETLVRLAISHAAQPSGSPEQVADDLTRLLGPFVDGMLITGDLRIAAAPNLGVPVIVTDQA